MRGFASSEPRCGRRGRSPRAPGPASLPARAGAALVVPLVLLLAGNTPARAQTAPPSGALDTCFQGSPGLSCPSTALAVQALTADLGLLTQGGVDLPGGASTLGWRVPGRPRIALFSRLRGNRMALPAFTGGAADPRGEVSEALFGWEFGAAVGAFRGFSLAPTVGGVLSLDLVGSWQWNLLPEDPGFPGDENSFNLGARVGVLRESFTLPGITVSARWSSLGEVHWRQGSAQALPGDPQAPAPAFIDALLDVESRSVRATVGKDFLAVGLSAGVGWDRYRSDGRVRSHEIPGGGGIGDGGVAGEVSFEDFTVDRTVFFGQAHVTFLVVQLAAEAGWAGGLDGLAEPVGGPYDPGAGRPFASLSGRLTF